MGAVRFFLDSANVDDIDWAVNSSGFVTGVTINQSLLAKEPKPSGTLMDFYDQLYSTHIEDTCLRHFSIPMLLPKTEIASDDPMVAFASDCTSAGNEVAIKIPVSRETMWLISALVDLNVVVNATCIYNGLQAALAAEAGAKILSVFVGRINDDTPGFGWKVIEAARAVRGDALVLAGSIRDKAMVGAALDHGAHIVTASRRVLEQLADDPGSARSIAKFNADYEAWSTP